MQLGRSGKCLPCKGGRRTTNLKPQQPRTGIIFTNADPRYAGRLDDKQGGDTIVTIKRVREATAFRTRLSDDSTVVAHIGANGPSHETKRLGSARGESRD